jgi:hypothetical protein
MKNADGTPFKKRIEPVEVEQKHLNSKQNQVLFETLRSTFHKDNSHPVKIFKNEGVKREVSIKKLNIEENRSPTSRMLRVN